jgi:hypothetical protein
MDRFDRKLLYWRVRFMRWSRIHRAIWNKVKSRQKSTLLYIIFPAHWIKD